MMNNKTESYLFIIGGVQNKVDKYYYSVIMMMKQPKLQTHALSIIELLSHISY